MQKKISADFICHKNKICIFKENMKEIYAVCFKSKLQYKD